MGRTLVMAMVLLLAACQGTVPAGTPAYQDGYRDGCNSGYADAFRPHHEHAYRLDQARFDSNADYKRGWEEAYAACFKEERDFPHAESGNNPN
ncbi:MAG: hypothetical protein U1F33_01915 [Alphaproteobacteria bacterium]